MKIFLGIIKYSALAVLLGILAATVAAYLELPVPTKPLVVQTGSMAPAIPAGSLVVISERATDGAGVNYVENDVITFKKGNDLVSHRVVKVIRENGEKYFQTKGDANYDNDPQLVAEGNVVGKVVLAAPFVGKLIAFIKQPVGFLLLVAVPTLFIIISELLVIVEEVRKKPKKKPESINIYKPITLTVMCLIFVGSSFSYFSDVDTSTNNIFSAAPIFPGAPGSVVINEINWSGSDLSGQDGQNDEWLELKNMTSTPINLVGWKISGAISGVGDLTITSGTIPAHGFFLISNFSEVVSRINTVPDLVTTTIQLDNSNAQYILKNSLGNTVDTADDGSGNPLAGANGPQKRSMERKIIPGDGTQVANWQTASTHTNMDGSGSTDEFGTPKVENGL